MEARDDLLNHLAQIKDDYVKLQSEYDALSNNFDAMCNTLYALAQKIGINIDTTTSGTGIHIITRLESAYDQIMEENQSKHSNYTEIHKLRDKLQSKSELIKEMEGHLSSVH
eukprot:42086_1